jgi:hypothetical protein
MRPPSRADAVAKVASRSRTSGLTPPSRLVAAPAWTASDVVWPLMRIDAGDAVVAVDDSLESARDLGHHGVGVEVAVAPGDLARAAHLDDDDRRSVSSALGALQSEADEPHERRPVRQARHLVLRCAPEQVLMEVVALLGRAADLLDRTGHACQRQQ